MTLILESGWGLLELSPDDHEPLLRALQRIHTERNLEAYADAGEMDSRLRSFAGGGPQLAGINDCDVQAVANSWLKWLATHPVR